MTMDFFMVTYQKDFPWLQWCLKSFEKFASGFRDLIIMVPQEDFLEGIREFGEKAGQTKLVWIPYRDWPGLGMVRHMHLICCADELTDASFIGHLDPDCLFTAPVTPATYITDGKPLLRFERFDSLGRRHPGAAAWREVTEAALPFPIEFETMRCHPEVYHWGLYQAARRRVEEKTGEDFEAYMHRQRNEFPQSFCEFNTLGNVALHDFPGLYHGVLQTGDRVLPDNHLQQFWSHGAIDQPQPIWVQGEERTVVPIEMIRQILQ